MVYHRSPPLGDGESRWSKPVEGGSRRIEISRTFSKVRRKWERRHFFPRGLAGTKMFLLSLELMFDKYTRKFTWR